MAMEEEKNKRPFVFKFPSFTINFLIFLLVLIVLFTGDPDIHDAIIHWLMK